MSARNGRSAGAPSEIARRTPKGFAASFDDGTLPFLSTKRGGKHSRVIREYFGETRIEDLWLPYFCVSTNLNRSELKVHSAGPLAQAVTASSRAPGVFPPLVIDGELHVDGGVINTVPVDVMRGFSGVGIVIGVDVSPSKNLDEVADYGDEVSGWQVVWSRFNPNPKKRSLPAQHAVRAEAADRIQQHLVPEAEGRHGRCLHLSRRRAVQARRRPVPPSSSLRSVTGPRAKC